MRLVTAVAAFETHRRMLEGERSALIAVAAEAIRFIRSERGPHRRPGTAVRIVAIDAAHRAFRQPMMIRFLELRPDIQMASRALRVDLGGFANHQTVRSVRVDLVAGHAGD